MNTKGLTGFQLKIIGLVLMVFDHIYEFFSYTHMVPIAFKWVGRLVAPIFIFMTVEGYAHTRNKLRYSLRLLLASVLMTFGNSVVQNLFRRPDHAMVVNNIFSTLFLITVYLFIVDFIKKSATEGKTFKRIVKTLFGIALLAVPFIPGALLLVAMNNDMVTLLKVLMYVPNPIISEGGFVFILIGVLLHLFRSNRTKQIAAYIVVPLLLMFTGEHSVQALLTQNYQWMMIFSAIFFYLYNGQKGRGMKWLFYIFYPAHIYFLYILSYLTFAQ